MGPIAGETLGEKPRDSSDSEVQQESKLSSLKQHFLLFLFCLGVFMEAYNGFALFTAIPTLVSHLGFTPDASPWIASTHQLTMASFLLIVSV